MAAHCLGTPDLEPVERKLTAIAVADVVGYSRLMGGDEEGTFARLREHRQNLIDPKIGEHRGRVFKATGDGLLIEFASVVNAVRCAVEIQRALMQHNDEVAEEKRISLRFGINMGDVIIDGDDIYGDGVNVAARLEALAEPNGILVSAAVRDHVFDKLGFAFEDLGEHRVKNIARPVRVYKIRPDGEGHGKTAKPQAPRLSIVVLPFNNMSRDPDQEYFVDGVTESLTTDLSRISGSFVVARNTAFAFKDKAVNAQTVGRELNVRYVLEGSVQRSATRLRVNVQLIDAESGAHLWADRFDEQIADLFEMQDEIVTRLARALDVQLVAAEAHRSERSANPNSMDLYFQGQAAVNLGFGPAEAQRAFDLWERALALDAKNVDAMAALAFYRALAFALAFRADEGNSLALAEKQALRAVELAPGHSNAHMALAQVYTFSNHTAQGMAEYKRALALDRNNAQAYAGFAAAEMYGGCAEESEAHIQEALRLSPQDAQAHLWCLIAGNSRMLVGQDAEAERWFRRGIEINRKYPIQFLYLSAALAGQDRIEEAKTTAAEAMALNPSFSIQRLRSIRRSTNPTYLKQLGRVFENMARAGVPEV